MKLIELLNTILANQDGDVLVGTLDSDNFYLDDE
jgi:hypothetical protein